MTSLIVSGIVLYAGITALVESIKKIINPETPNYNILALVILTAGIISKYIKKSLNYVFFFGIKKVGILLYLLNILIFF